AARHAGTNICDLGSIGAAYRQGGAITFTLCIWRFADGHNPDIAAVISFRPCTHILDGHRRTNGCLNGLQECRPDRDSTAATLPADRPASYLIAQIIYVTATDHQLIGAGLR